MYKHVQTLRLCDIDMLHVYVIKQCSKKLQLIILVISILSYEWYVILCLSTFYFRSINLFIFNTFGPLLYYLGMYSFLKSLDKLHCKTYNYTHVPIYFRFVFVYQDSTDSDPPRLLCALIGMQGRTMYQMAKNHSVAWCVDSLFCRRNLGQWLTNNNMYQMYSVLKRTCWLPGHKWHNKLHLHTTQHLHCATLFKTWRKWRDL